MPPAHSSYGPPSAGGLGLSGLIHLGMPLGTPSAGTMRFPTTLPRPKTTPTGPTGVASSGLADETLATQRQGLDGLEAGVAAHSDNKALAKANPQVSIIDFLDSKGLPSDYTSRAKMAQGAGITNYVGSPNQNAQLLGWMSNAGQAAGTTSAGGGTGTTIPGTSGSTPQGSTSSSMTTSTTTGGTPAPINTGSPGDEYTAQISDVQKQIGANYDDFKAKTDQIINGTFPLSPTQQASLDATQQKFDAIAKLQLTANESYENSVALAGNRLGLNVQNPSEYIAEQHKAVSDDLDKINNLDATAAKTMADLKQGFLDKDYGYINDQYNALQKTLEDKTNTIQAMQKRVDDMYTSTRDYNLKLAELQEKRREFNIQQAAASGSGSATVPTVPMTSNGTASKAGQVAFLASLPTDLATTIKAIAEYRQNPSSIPSKQYKGAGLLNQGQVLSLVEQYDPTYNQTQYATRQAALTNFASGKYSQNVTALKTAVGHISDLAKNFSAINNTAFTPYNWAKNNIDRNIGGGSISKLRTNADAVAGELAAVFKASGATDTEISSWRQNLTPNMSPAQSKAWIEQALDLMGTRLGVLDDQYRSALGKPKDGGFLSDDNASLLLSLKGQGYNFDMPTLSDTPIVRIQAFHDSSPEAAQMLQYIQSQAPGSKPSDILEALAQAGIDLD